MIRRSWRARDEARRRAEREIDEEIAFHVDKSRQELEALGMSPGDARRATDRRFGSLDVHRCNLLRLEMRAEARIRRRAMGEVWRVGIRSFVRGAIDRPGFALGIIAILALGLGVNAVTFHLVDRLVLTGPAGLDAPDRLYRVVFYHREANGAEIPDTGYSYLDYRDLPGVTALAGAAGETSAPQLLGSGSDAERIRGRLVTANYFSLLGVQPALGRFFTADESEREGARLVVLGHALWQRRFKSDPGILGRVLQIGSNRYTVVGVAPRRFTGSSVAKTDLFLPLEAASDEVVSGPWQTSRGLGWMSAIVRLAPGQSVQAAMAEATERHRAAHQAADHVPDAGRVELVSINAVRGASTPGDVSVAALASVLAMLVLVIAVANVANLFLARAIGRTSELAVKLALGGGRLRMIGEQAIEGALLSLSGALVALALAVQGTRAVQRVLFPAIDWLDSAITLREVWLMAACALAGGALAAGLPAWILTRASVVDRLKSTGQRVVTRRTRTQLGLLVVQAALSVVLLIGAGLFVRSLAALQRLDLGIETSRLLTVGVAPGDTPLRPEFWQMLRDRLQPQPDVERTSIVNGTIPFGPSWAVTLNVPGLPERPRVRTGGPYGQAGTPDYFETAGTSIVEGRRFTDADRQGAPLVAIVNQTLAHLYWPGQSAIGKCLQIGNDSPPCSTIVGVAENTRRQEVIEGDTALYYVPLAQAAPTTLRGARRLIVRAIDDRSATLGRLAEVIRREALALDPSLRFVGVQPIGDAIDDQLRAWRLGVTLFAAFGLLALVVAAVGLYSVVAFDVEGRRRELGLRAALGATSSTLVRLMLAGTLQIVGAGVLAGIAIAWIAAPLIGDLLYAVAPRDTFVFVGVASLLLVASLVATALPARRATQIDPGEALRDS